MAPTAGIRHFHLPLRIELKRDEKSGGWVTAQEVAGLPEWAGQRLTASLEAQIR